MTEADVEARSRLATHLGPGGWPATGEQLLAEARGRQAPAAGLDQLAALPAGRVSTTLQEAWAQLGGGTEAHRS